MMREGYFVEFGAADGVLHSNTLRLEADMGWTGLLAEPNSDFESALRRNRSADVDMRCVWPTSGAFVDLLVTDDPELSTVAGAAVSDAHSLARQRLRRVHKVETISLMDLLEEHQAPRLIDYLSIDTEGSELDILSAFDFSQYEIRFVSVEHNYRDDVRRLDALMTSKGFERRFPDFSACDAWYRRRS
jgi:FkbM family methyltransferase